MARRRWTADEWDGQRAVLLGSQARHLAIVLRARPGMRFEVVTGLEVWSAVVATVSPERVEFSLEAPVATDAALPLTLLLAIFKFDRMEWAIEKATELGVSRITPVIARRTEKHLAQAAAARAERWRRIAGEAARQSRRTDTPTLEEPVSLDKALQSSPAGLRLLLAENEHVVTLVDALAAQAQEASAADDGTAAAHDGRREPDAAMETALAVGPEGGWTTEEVELFAARGWQPVSLGPRILRAETAAVAGLAIAASAMLG